MQYYRNLCHKRMEKLHCWIFFLYERRSSRGNYPFYSWLIKFGEEKYFPFAAVRGHFKRTTTNKLQITNVPICDSIQLLFEIRRNKRTFPLYPDPNF